MEILRKDLICAVFQIVHICKFDVCEQTTFCVLFVSDLSQCVTSIEGNQDKKGFVVPCTRSCLLSLLL